MCSNTIGSSTHLLQGTSILQSSLHPLLAINPPSQSTILLRIPPNLPPGPSSCQKRLFPSTQNPIPFPLPFPLNIPCRDVLDGAVVPNGDISRRLPANARLDVMVLGDEVFNHGHESVAFRFGDPLETAAVHSAGEDGVPARNGVGADGGVDGLEAEAGVGRGATRSLVRALGAAGLGVVRVAPLDLEVLEELLERLAHPVVEIVRARVEGVSACVGNLAQTQRRIVARILLKRHVAVPFVRGRLALLRVGLVAVAFGDALRDQSDDFGVIAVERVERVCHDIVLGGTTGSSGNAVYDFFVGFIVEVLITEYGNATLGNCDAPWSEAIRLLLRL